MNIGAVTGNGVFSELEYKGSRLKVAQWYGDAMEAVSTATFLKASRMLSLMGGSPRQIAEREVALARTFALGGFGFDAIVDEGGLDNDDELLAVFLHKLLVLHDATVRYELAVELVKGDKQAVLEAVSKANPRKGQQNGQPGMPAPGTPASPSSELGKPSKPDGANTPA